VGKSAPLKSAKTHTFLKTPESTDSDRSGDFLGSMRMFFVGGRSLCALSRFREIAGFSDFLSCSGMLRDGFRLSPE